MKLNDYYVYIDGKFYNIYGSLEHLRQFLSNFISQTSFSKIEVLKHG